MELPPWRSSTPNWTQSWKTCSSWSCLTSQQIEARSSDNNQPCTPQVSSDRAGARSEQDSNQWVRVLFHGPKICSEGPNAGRAVMGSPVEVGQGRKDQQHPEKDHSQRLMPEYHEKTTCKGRTAKRGVRKMFIWMGKNFQPWQQLVLLCSAN